MDIKSLLNTKRRLSESDSPPIKRQKIDEEIYSDETLEEDEKGSFSDNMNFEDKITEALANDKEVDLDGVENLMLNETRHSHDIYWDRLWEALKHNTTLKELATGYCYGHDVLTPITDSHCIKLGEALKENHTLKCLEIDYHEYKSVGVSYIAEGLKVNKGLERLVLNENHLDFRALRYLGEALQVNTTLKELDLGQTISDEGDPADFLFLCEVLKTNTTLRSLSFSECTVSEELREALEEVKKVNKQLHIHMPDVPYWHRKKQKKKQAAKEEASESNEDDIEASDADAISEGAKSAYEDLQSPSGERSTRRAKLTARAKLTPLMTKKTRKRREKGEEENKEAKISESEAKNSNNETKNQDPAAKVQIDTSGDSVKEPITKKARKPKNTLNKTQNNVKSFGLRRGQRRAKLTAKRLIAPLMMKKTRKRRKNGEDHSDDETSKVEVSPARQQRKAKLLAAASLVPLMVKKIRKRRGASEEENNNNKKGYSKKNTNIKEEKLIKPKKYKKKKENKEENNTNVMNSPSNNNNVEIKVPANQRKAKYFARANITPLMIRKTRKRRKDAGKEKEEDRIEENNTNGRERKAKLEAQKSITPLVFKKTRKRRENAEENGEKDSPVKEKKEEKVKRGPGRPPKKRRFKGKSASSGSQETTPKPIVPFKPKHKFIRTYQAKPKELPRRLAKNENQSLDI